MELEELFKDRSEEAISAFAFNIGRTLETAIRVRSNNIEDENKYLKASILTFREKFRIANNSFSKLIIQEIDKHFNIELMRKS